MDTKTKIGGIVGGLVVLGLGVGIGSGISTPVQVDGSSSFTKLDDHTLQVVTVEKAKTLPAVNYDYGFLKQQLVDIQNQKDQCDTARDVELQQVKDLISKADSLGIKEQVSATATPDSINTAEK